MIVLFVFVIFKLSHDLSTNTMFIWYGTNYHTTYVKYALHGM